MARLNEPLQPAVESIDALKRRFVRQNRELARANSTQSVKIRTLECEVSQLVGDNVSLREEIIRLRNEVERNRNKYMLDGVSDVKDKLEAKLYELGILVRGLGDLQKTANIRRAQKRRSINGSSPKRSPNQKTWKNSLTLSEAVGGVDGRLPPIVEGKYYPRRTMDAEEISGTIADPTSITDSPDLGPPPVAHFEQGDPIKFDAPQDESPVQALITDDEEARPKLSVNLETRKKRRESTHRREGETSKSNIGKRPIAELGTGSEFAKKSMLVGTDQPLKSGAKRKLNVRDEEGTQEPNDIKDEGKAQSIGKPDESKSNDRELAYAKGHTTSKPLTSQSRDLRDERKKPFGSSNTNATSNRKVLGPKSVNSDPMTSPLKHNRNSSEEKTVDAKDETMKIDRERQRLKDKSQAKTAKQPTDNEAIPTTTSTIASVETRSSDFPPETPIPTPKDLFSPTASEPSVPRTESRDTPPPPDLGPDTGTGSFGRASRRPRGTVNYAQPNLRDKMRRPTAELVDAVAAEERARQAKADRAKKELDNVVIKKEDADDGVPIWTNNNLTDGQNTREEPTSPLSNKSGESSQNLPFSVMTERRRRTIGPSHNDDESKRSALAPSFSGAASAIAALSAGSHKMKRDDELPRSEAEEEPVKEARHENTLAERPSIYDFTGSSPNNGQLNDDDNDYNSKGKEEAPRPARSSSRRHSTVVSTSSDQSSKGTLSISRRGATGERRRESILGGRRGDGNGVRTGGMTRTKSVLELRGGEAEGAKEVVGADRSDRSRGERAVDRRRSMML